MIESSSKENEILNEAYQRGIDYLSRWQGCAPAVFGAVMDSLGYKDDPRINDVWKTTIGLTGGTGLMATGTCGALAGAAEAISYSFSFTPEDIENDVSLTLKINNVVAEIGKMMQEKYSHIVCQEVQFHHWGRAYRFTNPKAYQEYSDSKYTECGAVCGDLAKWTVKKILEYNPQFCKR